MAKTPRGTAPAAVALKTAPPDLTLLSRKNGGNFPAAHVLAVLNDFSEDPVHGSKEMPIWGPVFRSMGPGQSYSYVRSRNVTDYLKSIQAK